MILSGFYIDLRTTSRPVEMAKIIGQAVFIAEETMEQETDVDECLLPYLHSADEANELYQASISGYELGMREPPLPILLKYAEVAGVCMDVLINDKLDLPKKLPSVPDHKESARASASRLRQKR